MAHMSYSLKKILKGGLCRGLYKRVVQGLLSGILGISTIAQHKNPPGSLHMQTSLVYLKMQMVLKYMHAHIHTTYLFAYAHLDQSIHPDVYVILNVYAIYIYIYVPGLAIVLDS